VLSQKTTTKRVLLVEDDDLLRKSLSGYIGALGYEVIAADSAEEALLLCRPGNVDLVLTDYRLLTMNGIDLILTLRKSGLDVPCILISGFLSEEDRRRALEIRVTDILRKPWDLPRLQDLLPNLLGEVA
jgi:CheY-like chemotaxis protein